MIEDNQSDLWVVLWGRGREDRAPVSRVSDVPEVVRSDGASEGRVVGRRSFVGCSRGG